MYVGHRQKVSCLIQHAAFTLFCPRHVNCALQQRPRFSRHRGHAWLVLTFRKCTAPGTLAVLKPPNPALVLNPPNPALVLKPSTPTLVLNPSNPTLVLTPSNPGLVLNPPDPAPADEAPVLDMLRFMYAQSLQASAPEELAQVLIVADRYGVSGCFKHTFRLLSAVTMDAQSACLFLDLPRHLKVRAC